MIATFSCLHRCGDVKVVNGKFCVTYDSELSELNLKRLIRFQQLPDPEKVVFWSSSDLLWFDEVQFKNSDHFVSKGVWQEMCLRTLREAFPAFGVVDLGSMVVPIDIEISTTTSHFFALQESQSRMLRKSNRTEHSVEFARRVAAIYAAEGDSLARSKYETSVFYTHEESWMYYANLLLNDVEELDIRML